MEKIVYPLLYYPINEETLLGQLVGADIEAMDSSLNGLKKTLLSYLQKQYKKYDEYPPVEIKSPRLKTVELQVRPSYRSRGGVFPMPDTLKISLPIIYGQVEDGHFECHIPTFRENFFYYEPKQLDALVHHAGLTLLNQATPEKLYRLMRYPKPVLDRIELRVNYEREYFWGGWDHERNYEVLNRLAEPYPPTKSQQRSLSALPDAAWEREQVVAQAMDKIIGTRSNVLIVGRSGTGKSAVLTAALKRISNQSRKQKLGYTFWRIMPQRITASAKYLGEWEETVETLVEELGMANGIIWVEQMVQLLQTGGEGPENSVAAFLMNFLRQGKLHMVGEATPQELESMRRLLPGFVEAFQVIEIEELSEHQVAKVMEELSGYAAQNLKVDLLPEARELAYRLLLRYHPYASFPGKAISFLGQCLNEARSREEGKIGKAEVIRNFIQQTGLPELFLRDEMPLDIAALRSYFDTRIVGQPAAVEALTRVVKIFKAGLNNPNRPIASFLFAGPTGVGKTASVKALSEYFFGKGQRKSPLIRIDMSEFQHPEQMVRLIGAGRQPGQLIKEVRERPFSVLLLDEVEKADPAIFDALLGLLDEGVMVDAYGRETNFRNTIVIMTSNLGASSRSVPGFGGKTPDAAAYRSAVERHFRPEFVNRIDELVIFESLKAEDIRKITLKELEGLKDREGFVKAGLEVHFEPELVDYLARIGFDERYGARPLQRALEDHVVMPVARWMLKHPVGKTGQLTIGWSVQNRLTLNYQPKK
ncbi:MAG: AAA family ATPase [Phaeodactylibacter sp.]|uniref:AAA family ATPase n=1 Tax=Phaeodactylibacter sp. TaxID=1940289 RepID=UPI0032EEA9FA